MTRWSFTRDPVAFGDEAGGLLAADPLVATVVAGTARRYAEQSREPGWEPPAALRWFATARGADGLVGAAMRTHPAPPHALFVLPCPGAAALALARVLHERGEEVGGVNGALPAAAVVAEETARLAGGRVEEALATRLFEVDDVLLPPSPPGRLRRAEPRDEAFCTSAFARFDADADEQAGAVPGSTGTHVDPSRVVARVADGTLWVWERDDGVLTHVTATEPPTYGLARIAIVYTPAEHRGHGYAARAVAELARREREAGARVGLFADRDNPVSNHVYEKIGFRAVRDMVDLVVGPTTDSRPARALDSR